MKVLAENYKGIEFIRISKLPEEQRKQIVEALPSDNIIKILRDNELLVDCVQFKHYEAWFDLHCKVDPGPTQALEATTSKSFKLTVD